VPSDRPSPRRPRPSGATAPKPRPTAEAKDKVEGERLHVRIARSGFCSRRAAEKVIADGRVTVNGSLVVEMGVKVGPDDEVAVDGMPITAAKHYTVILNKPKGVVTTLNDPQGRPTIVRHLPDYGVPLKPVGRLDMDTEGVILCTNDGELHARLSHPRYGIEKEYYAIVDGVPDEKAIENLRKGVFIEGRKTAPAKVDVIHAEARSTSLKITIHEGRYRQIRFMCEAVGHPVVSLKRTRYGPYVLKGMRPGEAILLGKKDVDALRKSVGLPPL
jgi:23S rRNA pseudouridine2605 synthase